MMMLSTSILFIITTCPKDKLYLKMEMFIKDKSAVIYLMAKEFTDSKISRTTKENSEMVAFMEEEN
jgi:hypothetical protein